MLTAPGTFTDLNKGEDSMTVDSSQPLVALRPDAALEASPSTSPAPPLLQLWRALDQLKRAGGTDLAACAEELRRTCRQACEFHAIDVELMGPVPRGPVVLVANHLGYIDPVVLCSIVPCSPIAKSEIRGWPLIGEPLRRMNVSFVRRGAPESGARVLKQCLRTLRSGVSVLNFPEGTTSRGGLLPFQLGAFWLARKSGVPIVPVGMEFETPDMCWVDDEAFLPHYGGLVWSKLQGKRRRVRVCMGEPLVVGPFESEIASSWAARAAIAGLRRPYAELEPRRP
jgi:lyso-ornithine lipid O-acyltransferase